jgi:hypothetical protein
MVRGVLMINKILVERRSHWHPGRAHSRRFLFWSFVVMMSATELLMGQTVGKLSGKIIDRDTREPIIGCNVVIVGTKLGATTDIDGSYFILNIVPDQYDVEASMIGYQKVLEHGVIINSEKTTTVDFCADVDNPDAGRCRSGLATRPDVQPEKTSTSEVVRTDDVKAIAGMRDVTDVIGLAADVTDGHFRGGRTGEEYYTLQGMGIVNPFDATSAFVPILSAVEEVEVVTSGFGAQYGNAQSGVVNITMKEGKADKWTYHLRDSGPCAGKENLRSQVSMIRPGIRISQNCST